MIPDETASALVATIKTARVWLLDLDESIVRHKPEPDRWSIAEVTGHMIDSACNNHQRFVRAQEADQLTFPKYEERSWVEKAGYHGEDWAQLVEFWFLYNTQLAALIRRIPESKLDTPCTITPIEPCTLGFLVTDYVDHLKHHLGKIRERVSC